MVARNMDGAISVFPVSENIHRNQILHESIVPARMSEELQSNARKMAEKIADSLNLCGILGVEMFVGADGRLYVNELAPRPHNSDTIQSKHAISLNLRFIIVLFATGRCQKLICSVRS